MNETTIAVVGNLTADPELRYTQGGKAVANFTIASTPRTFDRQANEFKDGDALFLRCTAWEEFAEHIAGSLVKGSRVIAQGNLQQKSYDDKEGARRTSIELQVTAIGPDLRYATASVIRTQSGGGREPQGARSEQQQAQDWAQPQAQTVVGLMNEQVGYSDETPF